MSLSPGTNTTRLVTLMDLHQHFDLRHVINACGKMTKLCGSIVLPEIIDVVNESMRHFFVLDEVQQAAGKLITQASGAESGCITACTSAGITLSVAATMTGNNLARVLQLPDTSGLPSRVLIQKGHCVNYGAPITQSIRLAGAEPVEVGSVNNCSREELLHQLQQPGVASIVAVESHHTVRHGWVALPDVIEMAHAANVPVIVDGAAQDQRLRELIEYGSDLVITSAHKYLCATTAGIVAGRKNLIDAFYLQNRGIGRGMKAGKESIFGAMAALQFRLQQDMSAWTSEQDRKVQVILNRLANTPGLDLAVDSDPNGCPFSRVRLNPHPSISGHSARSLADTQANGNPTIVVRAHHLEEGYFHLDAIEMTDDEINLVCERIQTALTADK